MNLPMLANAALAPHDDVLMPPYKVNGKQFNSIWDCPKWPHERTRPTKYPPKKLRKCILKYGESSQAIKSIFADNDIDYHGAYDCIERYPEASTLYARAKLRRTEFLVDDVYKKAAEFEEFQYDSKGGMHQNSAGAKVLDTTTRHTEWLVERINPAFRLKTENYNTNINANLQAQIPLPEDCTLADILHAMHQKIRG
jgi:hypothetical protein